MELWFTELQKPGMKLSCKVRQTLYREQTPFQELVLLDTEQFGRMLVLDGAVQVTLMDEFAYHEMLAHVPMLAHPDPREILIIGGGDGGTAREVLRHQGVERVTMVELDRRVVEASRRFLPELSCSLDNPRLQILYEDGVEYVKKHQDAFDVVLIDSTDPVGQAARLFSLEFYQAIFKALRSDGIFAAQTESPFVEAQLIRRVYRDVGSVFPITRLYQTVVPTYPTALWTFTTGSKQVNPETSHRHPPFGKVLRYYNPEIHEASFKLPNFVKELLKQGD